MQFSPQNCEHKNAQAGAGVKLYDLILESRNRFLHHNFYSGTLGTIFFKSGTAWCAFVIETPPANK